MAAASDSIVIGAGIGGLYAGVAQAARGKRVLVLERHDQIGGYASKFRIRGFEFDVSLHLLGDFEGRGLGRLLALIGALELITALKPKYLYEIDYTGISIPSQRLGAP